MTDMVSLTITIPGVEKCPFCNGDSCVPTSKESVIGHAYHVVVCNKCGANGPRVYVDDESIRDIRDMDIRNVYAKSLSIEKWNKAVRAEEESTNE